MKRRRLLSTLAVGSVSLAGCLSTSRPGSTGTTTTDRTTTNTNTNTDTDPAQRVQRHLGESYTTDDGRVVTVHDARVQKSVVEFEIHTDIVSLPDRQFVVADVSVTENEGDERTEFTNVFSVKLDGTEFPQDEHVRWLEPPSEDGHSLGFPVPVTDADEAAVVWHTGDDPLVHWFLGDDERQKLLNAPAFEIREFSVPDSSEAGGTLEATLTVANVGDRDGIFRTELGTNLISDTPELMLDIPAGESATRTETIDVPDFASDDVKIVLDWGADVLTRTVSVEK
ncbi:hypothetical protein [Haladaptatus sp. NG-SE-30]